MLTNTQLTPRPNMPSPKTKPRRKARRGAAYSQSKNKIAGDKIASGNKLKGAKASGNKSPATKASTSPRQPRCQPPARMRSHRDGVPFMTGGCSGGGGGPAGGRARAGPGGGRGRGRGGGAGRGAGGGAEGGR